MVGPSPSLRPTVLSVMPYPEIRTWRDQFCARSRSKRPRTRKGLQEEDDNKWAVFRRARYLPNELELFFILRDDCMLITLAMISVVEEEARATN